MFHDVLKALKKRMGRTDEDSAHTACKRDSEEAESCSKAGTEEEVLDILSYVDKHGVVDKDLNAEEPSDLPLKKAKPVNPVISSPLQSDDEDVSVSDFEEDCGDVNLGAEEILAYVDRHGIELKSADLNRTKSGGEENVVRSKRSVEKQIDLHGLRAREAELKIREVFRDAKKRGYQQILIVHGRGKHSTGGDPVLKRMVVDLLEGVLEDQVASFYFAPAQEGGGGATRVVLK